jgi:hypothetical protein
MFRLARHLRPCAARPSGDKPTPVGRLAQLVERLLYTQDVGGSSPSSPTSLRGSAASAGKPARNDGRNGVPAMTLKFVAQCAVIFLLVVRTAAVIRADMASRATVKKHGYLSILLTEAVYVGLFVGALWLGGFWG